MPDAVVVGAGPNGLVAANVLADAGWSVVVLEGQPQPGGAVRSEEPLGPGVVVDRCSAFYPLAVASPAMRALALEEHGLRWRHAPTVLAHPLPDGRCAVLARDAEATARSVGGFAPGDADAWRRLTDLWRAHETEILAGLLTPFPPLRAAARLLRGAGPAAALRLARLDVLPVRRLVEEEFAGEGAALLLAGCAAHAALTPEAAGGTLYGWLLAMLGQTCGYPVPEGGAGRLTAALVRRLEARGGRVVCSAPVTRVLVRGGRAVGVRTAAGDDVRARRAVLADVAAPHLYGGLVGWEHLPPRLRDDLSRFRWDLGTVKVDWVTDGPVPWTAPAAGTAGTVHVAPDLDALTLGGARLAMGQVPERPFVLVGQMTVADPGRSPTGLWSTWGYTRVPRSVRGDAGVGLTGRWDDADLQRMADRVELEIEAVAPGFRARVRARRVLGPRELAAGDTNLDGGALNGGTAELHQQLVFRPTPGLARPETPVAGLYLASASAHPGGGVHGACGANAAHAALRSRRPGTRVVAAAHRRLLR